MSKNDKEQKLSEQLKTLLGFLESDPTNLSLLSDTAETALNENHLQLANELLTRYESIEPFSSKQLGISGLAAMQSKNFELASKQFASLMENNTSDPAIRFNLAWSLAMLKNYDEAIEVIDENTASTLPQAAMLEVQILHQLGKFEDAGVRAKQHLKTHPDDTGLAAAISVLAMDNDDEELARMCAEQAGDHPDALTTLGTLVLGDDDGKQAIELFDKALAINPHGPRTWLGKGLAQLATGDTKEAAKNIDQGAEMFGTHLGSWIAAGWAYFIMDDLETSRQRFQHALGIDDTFAETHGSLAVLDVLSGNFDQAKLGIRTAMRLDKECFSAALAQTLILSSQGNSETAKKIFERAINTPIDGSDRTIAQSLVRMGMQE